MKVKEGILLCLLMLSLSAVAQVKNLAGFSVGLGYNALLDNQNLGKPGAGVIPSFAGVYELQYKHFIFHTGLEADFGYSQNFTDNVTDQLQALDTEGDQFTYNLSFSNFRNESMTLDVNIPLLIGGQWDKFYFLVGPKLMLNVIGKAKVSVNLTSTAHYDRFIDDFNGMDNHQLYTDFPIQSEPTSISFSPQVAGYIELGRRLETHYSGTGFDVPKTKRQYRIAVFAQYGILNMRREDITGPLLNYYDSPEGLKYEIHHVYLSDEAQNLAVRNFSLGVKFTMLFNIPEKVDCVICSWTEQKAQPRAHGGTRIEREFPRRNYKGGTKVEYNKSPRRK